MRDFEFTGADVSRGSYDAATGEWIVGWLDAGETLVLEIRARVLAGGPLTNIVEVVAAEQQDVDSTPANADTLSEDDDSMMSITAAQGAGACSGRVIINEVAWAGTAVDPQSQWIELRNIGTEDVDLRGWTLRWRKKAPVTEEDYIWKLIRLSGTLRGAGTSACVLAEVKPRADIEFAERNTDDMSWLVIPRPQEDDGSYLLLERKSDDTIGDIEADIVYDLEVPYRMDLTLDGDILQLRDTRGRIIDTANDFEPYVNGWPAGDASISASMERTDPLRPDAPDNWHTNLGIVTEGEDALGRPLVATARALNSQTLDEWTTYAEGLAATEVVAGSPFDVELNLTLAAQRDSKWHWIRVSQPSQGVGGGGGSQPSTYGFSNRLVGDVYWVTIDTTGLEPGRRLVWIVAGEREGILVPIGILP